MTISSWLDWLLAPNHAGTKKKASSRADGHSTTNRDRRPVDDKTITIRSANTILESHQDLIQRIKLSYGCDQETFQRELLPLIQRYIEFVLDLPATPNHFFCQAGGMVALGLRTAFYALQATDDQIFEGRASITKRRHLELRWRKATFIAGLCAELHRTLSHIHVSDVQNHAWQPYLMPLGKWVERHRIKCLIIQWEAGKQETRSLGLYALPFIVTAEIMADLAEENNVVVPHMLASISGSVTLQEHNLLDDLVRRAAAFVIDLDLQDTARAQGTQPPGLHLGRYFLATMQELVVNSASWRPNTEKSRVWFGPEGLFVVWPNAFNEVLKILDEQLLPGLPKSADQVLDILLDNGMVQPQDQVQSTWLIRPPSVTSGIEAIKLVNPALLLNGVVPSPIPLSMPLLFGAQRPPPAPASAPHAPTPAPADIAASTPASTLPRRPLKAGNVRYLHIASGRTAAKPPAPNQASGSDASQQPATHLVETLPTPAVDSQPDLFESTPCASPPQTRNVASPTATTNSSDAVLSFKVPMRLNHALVKPLSQIIHTMNLAPSLMACCTTAAGIFIPLSELAKRQVDIQIAVRAMAETSMLVQHRSGPTTDREFQGKTVPGVVLKPAFVHGLHGDDFNEPDT
ncbi:MobH family relaxase [Janthinobacterium sp. PSPC3-1]|uniref:MobH family relaxase n=1 Tax=Janthinobacterium sp. PSPC3-1 TaxID=2804653 RepID=UPI003CF691BA